MISEWASESLSCAPPLLRGGLCLCTPPWPASISWLALWPSAAGFHFTNLSLRYGDILTERIHIETLAAAAALFFNLFDVMWRFFMFVCVFLAGIKRKQEHPNPAVPRWDRHDDPVAVWCHDCEKTRILSQPSDAHLQNLPKAPSQLLPSGIQMHNNKWIILCRILSFWTRYSICLGLK